MQHVRMLGVSCWRRYSAWEGGVGEEEQGERDE